ncbi:MAG: rod shape-determining protein MreD [PVC group bacterium]
MNITVRRPIHHFIPARGRKWRVRFVLFLFFLAAVVIQGSAGKSGLLFDFRPDLVLIVVVYWSLQEGLTAGWFSGMAGGFLADLFSAGVLGLHSLTLAATGMLAAFFSSSLYRGHLTTRVVMVAAASGVNGLLYYLLLVIFSSPPAWSAAWRDVIWPAVWQTTLVSPLWLWLTDRALGREKSPGSMNREGREEKEME